MDGWMDAWMDGRTDAKALTPHVVRQKARHALPPGQLNQRIGVRRNGRIVDDAPMTG